MIIVIDNLGQIGLNKDVQPHALPPNALSDSSNVRFIDGEIRRVNGWQSWVSLNNDGYYVTPYEYLGEPYWVTAGSDNVKVWIDGVATDITPAAGITGTESPPWTSQVFNNILVMNNTTNVPLYWLPGETELQALPAWDATWTAKHISSFKNLLIAFNLTESGTNFPTKYRWSALAEPGALPASWDESDATIVAGSDILDATQSEIITAEPLADYMVVYTKDSAHLLTFTGGQFVLAERPLLKRQGCLARYCVKEFYKKHFVVSDGDIYVHDGQNPESILKGRLYSRIFPNLEQSAFDRSFVVTNWLDEEMWFCFPETGNGRPNVAAMWSWRYNTWQVRDINSSAFINYGRLPSSAPTVTSPVEKQLVSIMDDGTGLTPGAALTPGVALTPSDGSYSLFIMESTQQEAGANMTCTFERTGLKPEQSDDGIWMIRAAYPLMEGGAANFYFGAQDSPNEAVNWDGPHAFTPEGAGYKIDLRVTGRYLAYKAEMPPAAAGAITGMKFDVVRVGRR